jgi:large subunit ribosomal protein L21e
MVTHHGYRSKTRRIFRKDVRQRGLRSLSKIFRKYEIGDKVDIIIDPSFQKRGMPHKRFHGKTGIVVGIRGRCYEVSVKDIHKEKLIIVGREHLRMNKFHELEKSKLETAELNQ